MIHEFCDDNVRYLELRSTPREVTETGMTKELYVDAVLRAIRDCEAENLDIEVKLLLAIDRRNGVQVGQDTVKLAQKFRESHPDLVVGIDLSGDPSVSEGQGQLSRTFVDCFALTHSKQCLSLSLSVSVSFPFVSVSCVYLFSFLSSFSLYSFHCNFFSCDVF